MRGFFMVSVRSRSYQYPTQTDELFQARSLSTLQVRNLGPLLPHKSSMDGGIPVPFTPATCAEVAACLSNHLIFCGEGMGVSTLVWGRNGTEPRRKLHPLIWWIFPHTYNQHVLLEIGRKRRNYQTILRQA